MSKTAAERQKEYRDRQRNTQNAMATAAGVIIPVLDDGIERNAQMVTESPKSVTVEHGCNAQMVTAGVTAVTGESCTELDPTDHALIDGRGGLADYYANPDKYIPRTEPDKLNWGPWLNTAELNVAGLKANRVPIPGDWDYEGVGHE